LISFTNLENEASKVKNQYRRQVGGGSQTAADYRGGCIKWGVIGDHSYSEGYSRGHAASQIPWWSRCLHLLLPLYPREWRSMRAIACVDPANDDKVQSNDKVTILLAWTPLRAGKISTLVAEHKDNPKMFVPSIACLFW
jgi:hypothetical protein